MLFLNTRRLILVEGHSTILVNQTVYQTKRHDSGSFYQNHTKVLENAPTDRVSQNLNNNVQ